MRAHSTGVRSTMLTDCVHGLVYVWPASAPFRGTTDPQTHRRSRLGEVGQDASEHACVRLGHSPSCAQWYQFLLFFVIA